MEEPAHFAIRPSLSSLPQADGIRTGGPSAPPVPDFFSLRKHEIVN